MEFSRPEYWSGKPFPSPGDLPRDPRDRIQVPHIAGDSLPPEPQASILDRTLLSKRSMDEAKGKKITQILKLPIGGTLPISFFPMAKCG